MDSIYHTGGRRWPTHLLTFLVVVLVVLAGVILPFFPFNRTKDRVDWQRVSANARDTPTVLPVTQRPSIDISVADAQWLSRQMRPEDARKLNVSRVLHLMHVHGKDYRLEISGNTTVRSMLDILTDEQLGRLVLGAPPMILTDTGVRYVSIVPSRRLLTSSGSGESHRDQFLASMAELGVPLCQAIVMNEGRFSLRDVLSDSLAQFNLEQDELEWTAFAYAAYLPPQTRWVNRYGEEYSFDDLVARLLVQSLEKSTCCGMHVVFALTAVLQADSGANHLLSERIRRQVDQMLHKWIDLIIHTQLPDGGWPASWWDLAAAREATDGSSLLATSHIAEWLYMLPSDCEIPSNTSRKATGYLLSRLKLASKKEMWQQFCPYSHSCHVLRCLAHSSEAQACPSCESHFTK